MMSSLLRNHNTSMMAAAEIKEYIDRLWTEQGRTINPNEIPRLTVWYLSGVIKDQAELQRMLFQKSFRPGSQ